MSWCVEYWKIDKKPEGSHAQMSEQLKFVKPDPKDVSRRYFDKYESATIFAQSMFDSGNYFSQVSKE
jgi:hypothetical protein